MTVQGSYHRDQNALAAPDGIRYRGLDVRRGDADESLRAPGEPTSITGGYGIISGLADHSVSSRQQIRGAPTFYAGNHEIKAGGDYRDGRTEAIGFFTGRAVVRDPERVRAALLRPHVLRGRARTTRRPWRRSSETPGPRLRRLPAGLLEGRARPHGQPRAALGRRATRELRGQTVLRLQTCGSLESAWSGIHGATARRRCTLSPGDSRTRCRRRCRGHLRSFTELTDLQLRSRRASSRTRRHRPRQDDVLGGGPSGDSGRPGARLVPGRADRWGRDDCSARRLTVGLKGTSDAPQRPRGPLRPRLHRSRNEHSSCGLMNLDSEADSRAGTSRPATASTTRLRVHHPGPATPAVARIYRGIELIARRKSETVSGCRRLHLLLAAGQLRRRRQSGGLRPDLARHQQRLRLSADVAQRIREALARPADRFRLDGYWNTPWRLSVGLQAFAESGAPLHQMGYFNQWYGSDIPRSPGLGGRLPT